MPSVETFFGLLAVVAALTWVAQRIKVEYPILLVVGGFLMLFRPDYVAPLYQTGTGKMMLVAAGFGMLSGTMWMQRIIKKVEV